jgi:hypothetical protein
MTKPPPNLAGAGAKPPLAGQTTLPPSSRTTELLEELEAVASLTDMAPPVALGMLLNGPPKLPPDTTMVGSNGGLGMEPATNTYNSGPLADDSWGHPGAAGEHCSSKQRGCISGPGGASSPRTHPLVSRQRLELPLVSPNRLRLPDETVPLTQEEAGT